MGLIGFFKEKLRNKQSLTRGSVHSSCSINRQVGLTCALCCVPRVSMVAASQSCVLIYTEENENELIDFIAKKKTMVVGNAQRKTAQKVVPISVS
jgi:hypothetical protein